MKKNGKKKEQRYNFNYTCYYNNRLTNFSTA